MQTGSEGAGALAEKTVTDAMALVRSELDVAKRELRSDVDAARSGVSMLLLATGFGVVGTELVLGALLAAGRRHPLAIAFLGFGCLGAAAALGASGLASLPNLLSRTRRRVAQDATALEESLS